jgi:broad specificity phosphatase PhoE
MRILLARHGETPWNVEGRYQGRSRDIALSDTGRAQAQALGRRLEGVPIARAVASPLRRAQETARWALGGRDLPLTLDERFMEVSYGEWEGRLASEVQAERPDLRLAWRDTPHLARIPGGETFQEVADRVWPAFVEATAGLGSQEIVLIVTHDGVNRVLLARILGLHLSRIWSFRQAPATLNLLEGDGLDSLQVVRLNDAAHLFGLFGEAVHRRL